MLVVRHEDVLSSSVGPAGLTERSLRGRAEMFSLQVAVLNTEGLVFV